MSHSEDWQRRRDAAIGRGMGTLHARYIQRADNAELWDVEGRRYIDFAAGIAVVNTGHRHPRVLQAVQQQLQAFTHLCPMITPYEGFVELAERLNARVPIAAAKTIFATTGAEAVENALKLARAHTGRSGVIAFRGGYHGRTHMTMGVTGKVKPYKAGFAPFPPDIVHIPFPVEYHGITVEQSLAALQEVFHTTMAADTVGALIVEPVQGEGGFYPAPPGFLAALRAICNENGIVFICDEIQTGFGRTGRWFAVEHDDVEPDLMTLAKGLAGGFPLAAVVGKAAIIDAAEPGGLGGTYAASPVGCAAALAVLDVIEEEGLVERANVIGETMIDRLRSIQARYARHIGQVRHRGAMVALEWVHGADPDCPDTGRPGRLVQAAAERGLLILPCGVRGNGVRLLAPLTITDALLEEGLDILEVSIGEVV